MALASGVAGTLRAIGPFNGLLPEASGMVVGFIRDPNKMKYLQYTQLIPAPEILYMYFTLDPDEPVRMVNMNENAWAYDDYRPTGKGTQIRGQWTPGNIKRWDFPATIGDATQRVWQKQGISPKMLYDEVLASQAALHRAQRVVTALQTAAWPASNTSDLNVLLATYGLASGGAYFDLSSGNELDGGGMPNANFQIIKKTFNVIKRLIGLSTNMAVEGDELVAVFPPIVAAAISQSGEIVNAVKQSPFAMQLTSYNIKNWGIPDEYAGFKLVVEDQPRCYVNMVAAGTVASVGVQNVKDFILNEASVYFVSRKGGLDGGYGFRNFSTVQVYHFNGEARMEAFSDPRSQLVETHVVLEDDVQTPALVVWLLFDWRSQHRPGWNLSAFDLVDSERSESTF